MCLKSNPQLMIGHQLRMNGKVHCNPGQLKQISGGSKMGIEISHITFIVKDLDRSGCFLEKVFSAKEIYSSGQRTYSLAPEKFYLIEKLWICIQEGEPFSQETYNHIAFKVDENELEIYIQKLKEMNIKILRGRSRVEGEGKSIYFYDFDNHLFELHTGTLAGRLKLYK